MSSAEEIVQQRSATAFQAPLARAEHPAPGATLGGQLRAARLASRLSLRALSSRSGLSPSYLSTVERGVATPSAATLQRLSSTLGITIHALQAEGAPSEALLRSGRGPLLHLSTPGVTIENLAPTASLLEPQKFTIQPGADSGGSYCHEGEDFLYVLRGALDVWLDEEEYFHVVADDSLTFSSHRMHRWGNGGRETAVIVWVNTPPTF